jgi:hypothetical protein
LKMIHFHKQYLYFFFSSFIYKVLHFQMQTLIIISPLSLCVVLGG